VFDIPSEVHPNAVCGILDAVEAKFGIPVVYSPVIRNLATERAASWLSKHVTYWWLERQGLGRVLNDSDGLWSRAEPATAPSWSGREQQHDHP
jgi:hypothetical protein